MERSIRWLLISARVLLAVVFLLNGFGIINQAIPAQEMMERACHQLSFRSPCLQGDSWKS